MREQLFGLCPPNLSLLSLGDCVAVAAAGHTVATVTADDDTSSVQNNDTSSQTTAVTGACGYNRPCAHQICRYILVCQSCMVYNEYVRYAA